MSLKGRIIVKDIVKEPKLNGSIWMPPTVRRSYKEMEVVRGAAGSLPKGLNVGDIIYVRPTAGLPLENELSVINRGDVLLIA